MYKQRPQEISEDIWENFVEWFLSIPDVDETLLLPDMQGVFNVDMIQFLTGYTAGFDDGYDYCHDEGGL